jgi:superfamily II DNA or RNA helicase
MAPSPSADFAGLPVNRYQAGYWAHWLTLPGNPEQSMTQTLAGAKVDLNPHQVEAALFALRSPVSRGVLLADEVGLGKTIEASLVLAQKWAQRQRRLLLVVPASLRKQWSQELAEKFGLRTLILETRGFNDRRGAGIANPFDTGGDALVICSYEFAAHQHEALAALPWDLVVFDEAHKLRNIYKAEGSGTGSPALIATRLNQALQGRPKILLSATPLQNNLQELYGLVYIIDPHFFGGLAAFKTRYCRGPLRGAELEGLRDRLQSIVRRTLRRQVQEEGGVRFTRRYSLTEDFTPSDDEVLLYEQVSEYLQEPELLAIQRGARHLVTLVVRKILASSSRAIAGTLATMIERLEHQLPVADESLADFDTVADLVDAATAKDASEDADSAGTAPGAVPDPALLRAEIDRLRGFQRLAAGIAQDRKAQALLRVLGKAFEMTQRLGGARKAVIFTESVRTQAWLFELLDALPTLHGRVVMLNGSNADPQSRRIYQDWRDRHAGTAHASGSPSADMKAALVERFRDFDPEQDSLLLCTEAGAEGINLQFCSLLINYDLPWNPQRVEQRIGRVHRYGQMHDVVVVNFLNRRNVADRRVFELLSKKFKLFEGVFGASDEVLGAIESGVDIEQRIHAIYQKCRSDSAIQAEFDAFDALLSEQISTRDAQIQRSLFDQFDESVVRCLKLRRERAGQQMGDYQRRLLDLARLSLPDARFEPHRFFHAGQWHHVEWPAAQAADAEFFQPGEGLGQQLIITAKEALAATGDAEVVLIYADGGRGRYSDLRLLLDSATAGTPVRGILVAEKLSLRTPREERGALLLAARLDGGQALDRVTCERLLSLPAQAAVPWAPTAADLALTAGALDQQAQAMHAETEAEHARHYQAESDKLDRWAEDRRIALDLGIRQLDADIKDARRTLRQLVSLQDKLDARRTLQKLERERDQAMLAYHEEKKRIEAEEDRLLAEAEAALRIAAERERLFCIRWQLQPAA